jgi:hypothetical protein
MGEGLGGVQKAYDANGALIVEAQWNKEGKSSIKGSWLSAVLADQTNLLGQQSQPAPLSNSLAAFTGSAPASTSATPAGNPSSTQIVIFQYAGPQGAEPAYCADEGADGVMCRSDSSPEIGRGTYKDFMIPGSPICMAGAAGCIVPKTFDASKVKG